MSNLHERESYLLNDTLTIGQLIEVLQKYPKDMKVLITWESTLNEIKEDYIYEAITGTLYLDGDTGFYKDYFMRNVPF